ncbi:uncharacterized protein LOC126847742 isoform X2 [Adelges cooleyi]|uniref:uncharacterized protein LOC126847742 isoform X2 n=1 Tax=Adelges cooleyi TaxID=133065 RepID=UPI0021800DC9|nr:uncharacterized protein LOC126847742 isoform X2 [Adelges cooleyi]
MKLLGILISFALVGHVLVTKLDDYIEEVILTNEDIKQAKKFMPEIIKHIVVNYEEYWPEAMAFMLAVPEALDVKLAATEYESDSDSDESDSISDENIDGKLEGPGPSQNQIQDLNPGPSTVPEEDIEIPNSDGKSIIELEEKLLLQKMMRLAILALTDRSKYENIMQSEISPDTIPIQSLDLNYSPDSKKENLVSLLEKRSIRPTAVPRNRIIRSFRLTTLGRARREMVLEALTLLIRQNDPVFQDLFMMCRLAAVLRSIKYPLSYIIFTLITKEYCYLISPLKPYTYTYKFNNGEFWEIDENRRTLIKPFLSELQ